MKKYLLGLGLIISVSFLDVGQGLQKAWAYDLPAAQTALKNKEYETVVKLLSPEISKLNREGLFILAKAYTALKKHDAAIKAYVAALVLNPQDHEAKTLIGVEQMTSGKDKEAIITLKDAIDMNPKYLPAYKALGIYYEKKQNIYELRVLYEDIVSKFGENAEAITKLCEVHIKDRLYDAGTKYCMKGIQLAPKIPENYIYLGLGYKDNGNAQKAEEYLKKAAEDFPKSELAQMTYAKHLDEKKDFNGSYNYYKRALSIVPDSLPAMYGYGIASVETQKYAESLETFEKACKIDRRKTLPSFRQALKILRTLKNAEWLEKFEDSLEKCLG